jgi:chaperonin GroES
MLKPLGDRILVKPTPAAPLTSESGIEIVGGYTPPAVMGTVEALGDTHCPHCKTLRPPHVSLGDVVIFAPSAGEDVEVDGQSFIMLREADLLAVASQE